MNASLGCRDKVFFPFRKVFCRSMRFVGEMGESLELEYINEVNKRDLLRSQVGELRIVWNRSEVSTLKIDGIPYEFQPEEMFFLTDFHHVELGEVGEFCLFRFNKPFYCLDYHDPEIGCRGVLFYGSTNISTIRLSEKDRATFQLLWEVFTKEVGIIDQFRVKMLRMLLKRWIILCLRSFREENQLETQADDDFFLVREFHYLVEQHYRKLHKVQAYADLLHRSPKTLSNQLSKYYRKTPLQVIRDRLYQEARRLLLYSDKQVSEISFDLGFSDVQAFSRFFRQMHGASATQYREAGKQVAG